MEDFTKPFKIESTTLVANNAIEPKVDLAQAKTTPAITKKGFIESRMNKDNFWNVMFGVGVTLGFSIAGIANLAILLAVTLVVVSYIIKKSCKITFTENKKFINSEGKDITDRTPQTLFWMILFILGLIGLSVYIKSHFLAFFSICFAPSLYFILINCPISILFNYQFLKQNARSSQICSHNHSSERSWWSDPMKSDMPGNIFYKRH